VKDPTKSEVKKRGRKSIQTHKSNI